MRGARPSGEPGADEERWLTALADLEPPVFDVAVPDRIVVVAPHPDDQVLGVGGLVRQWAEHGAEVLVIAVTDGDPLEGVGAVRQRWMARRRTAESQRALRRLGLSVEVERLSLPGGVVDRATTQVRAAVEAVAGEGTWCATTWREDGDPDHEATGRATAAACAATGARLLEFPVWMWQWADPHDPRVPWEDARTVFLDAPSLLAKRAALRELRTQVSSGVLRSGRQGPPVLPPPVLDRFRRPFELVFA